MTVRMVPLRDVCRQDRVTVRPGEHPSLRYLGLESIEAGSGSLVEGELSKTPEAPQANSFLFGPQHVLYGKLRPYLNKVFVPNFEGKCSTEIIPLLTTEELDPRYLAYFLRTPSTVHQIAAKTAGARMPRADMDFVFGLEIWIPPLTEQRRIVDILSRAEGIVRLRREAQAKAQAIIPALFIEMFGDPATNPKGWPVHPLGDLLRSGPSNGLYKHKSAYGRGTPILRIDAFYDGKIRDLAMLKRVELSGEDEVARFCLKAGDIVINRVNSPEYLGKSTIIPELSEPTVFESNMMRLSVDRDAVLPDFLIAMLQQPAARRHFLSRAKHAINQSSINQQDVKTLPTLVPPLLDQAQFKERVEALAAIIHQQAEAFNKASAAFASLLARSFAYSPPGPAMPGQIPI